MGAAVEETPNRYVVGCKQWFAFVDYMTDIATSDHITN